VTFEFNLFGDPSLLGVKVQIYHFICRPSRDYSQPVRIHNHLWDGVPIYTVCTVFTKWLLQLPKCS